MTELPRKAAARTARLAALPLGFAGRQAVGLGKRIGGRPAEAVLAEMQQRTAEQLFRTLGDLKGGAMKLGQALSVMEAGLPEELVAPYRETLTRLQDSAPPMSGATVRKVLTRELGTGWRTSLVELDETPSASASIGQVHRGRWHDGREVAVKVQYPGAGDALRADLRQIGRLSRTLAVMVPHVNVKELVRELQERVSEELDYTLEAQAQHDFAVAYRDDPDVVVPDVVTNSETVLVTEWMDSEGSLARLVAEGTEEQRDHYGELYVRFLFEGPERVGMLHADPHPGNFRLLPAPDGGLGKLGVVDFGAVARLPDRALPRAVGTLMRLAVADDYEGMLECLREEGFVRDQVRIEPAILRSYLGPFLAPAGHERFRFTRDWMRAQFERLNDPAEPGFTLPMKINMPPSYLLIHRVWLGAIGVLSQLEAEAPLRSVLTDSLPDFAQQA